MYRLEVFYDGALQHVELRANAAEVLDAIPELLREHAGCERIVVTFGSARLFAVDCKGNTSPA
jgi:hypothetical protein